MKFLCFNHSHMAKSGFLATSLLISSLCMAQKNRLPDIQTTKFRKDTLHITDYGAQPHGLSMNTPAINEAITAANQRGGGVVLVPAGLWLTGPIVFQSNVNVHLEEGAVLLFTDDFDAYPLVEANWEGQPAYRNQSPISGENLENIALTGKGVIDGNGGAWRMVKRGKMTDAQWKKLIDSGGIVDEKAQIWYPTASAYAGSKIPDAGAMKEGTTREDVVAIKDFLRPNLLVFKNSKRILLEDITVQNSPAWNLHPLICEDLIVRNITVRNPWYAQNGDGLDIESCKNVLIEGSSFDVGDDAICIKSGRDKAGRERGIPTENVIIRNNVVYHGHGGFVIGSEMSGGARNIWVENCTFLGTDIGLRFKTTRGRGGVVENINIRNIQMVGIPNEAILFDMYYGVRDGEAEVFEASEETPQFKNFDIRDVHVKGAGQGVFFRGLPEMAIQNIMIHNSTFDTKEGIALVEASGIQFHNVTLQTSTASPGIRVDNSRGIVFDQLSVPDTDTPLMTIDGPKSADIRLNIMGLQHVKDRVTFSKNTSKDILTIQ